VRESRPAEVLQEPAPPWWEQALCVLVIAMLTGALIGPVFAPTQEETPILRLVWLPVYAIIAGLLALRANKMVRSWPAVLILGALVLHASASQYWSIDAETTNRRVVALAITGLFSAYLGARFHGPHLPRLLMHAGLWMAVGSMVMVAAFPTIGIHQAENAPLWRGLWYEKNQMGLVMVAGATAAAACLASSDPRRLMPVLALAATTALVLATQSKTSLVCLILGLAVITALWILRKGGPVLAVVLVWLGVVLIAVGSYVFISDPEIVLVAMGKDPSLTGRTDIWASLMRRVSEEPWTGYGYAAFWGRESVPADFVRSETGWRVPSAHNGWLDLLVQLGWPGVISVGAVLTAVTLILLVRLPRAGAREGYWGIAYILVFVLLSMSESVLLSHANLPWALCVAILARAVSADPVDLRAPALESGRPGRVARVRIPGAFDDISFADPWLRTAAVRRRLR
jgi:exopolysaccharide production protein ExoQ